MNHLASSLLLEYNGLEEGWAIVSETGKIINPFILTAAGLSYYISQHHLAKRISNLDALGSQQLILIAKRSHKK
ncbi:hypothetical protein [Hymenobacter terricola]|uniref:hypothetical protein n=1 Tax=Hymenobacter terricola TaxID=2819236 RepID=UPI001B3106D3|nr:hypothetical protein [Hymenobacter terricola]